MNIHILTLFPDAFPGSLGVSLIGKALKNNIAKLYIHDLKDFAVNDMVDDKPYGGGAGMVIKCEVIDQAIQTLQLENTYKIYTSPRGYQFKQSVAQALVKIPKDILFLCGRYEGVDQRVLDKWDFNPISIGDYVLCGGEVAVLVMLETMIRLMPGVVGKEESLADESFSDGLLEYNQYTTPAIWENRPVPEVLLSGDHGRVKAFREAESKMLTVEKRKDLWDKK